VAVDGRPTCRGHDADPMHQRMAATRRSAIEDIRCIQSHARANTNAARPRWPMIVLRSPKGWTGPKVVDGLRIEGTFRAHQVPLLVDDAHPEHVAQLEAWMKSYKAWELFDASGKLIPSSPRLRRPAPTDGGEPARKRGDFSP